MALYDRISHPNASARIRADDPVAGTVRAVHPVECWDLRGHIDPSQNRVGQSLSAEWVRCPNSEPSVLICDAADLI
jgi:hypothetical protein